VFLKSSAAVADTWDEYEREMKFREERDRKQAEVEERESIAAAILNDQTYLEENYLKKLTNQQVMRKLFKESNDLNTSSVLGTLNLTKEDRLKRGNLSHTDVEWNWIYEVESKGYQLPDSSN
jgi:hypothetical protein